jgi:hypothetical protein
MKSRSWWNETPEMGIEAMVAIINDEEKLIKDIKDELSKRKAIVYPD